MNSVILNTATRFLQPLLLLYSVFLLLAGHNEPGGGFAGGLVASAAFALSAIARGVPAARRSLWFSPRKLMAAGLLLAVGSGAVSLFRGYPFLTSWWFSPKFGTPLLFDAGVYLVVIGATTMILFALGEE